MFLSLETLTSIIRTVLPILVELIDLVNSVIIILSQMTSLRWLTSSTRIPDCDSNSPSLLDLFITSDNSICSTMAFPPLGNSDHVVVSVSIDFPSNVQQDAPFHHKGYDYSGTDWDSLHDHLRDVPWNNIFKLGASPAASELCESAQVVIDLYIHH